MARKMRPVLPKAGDAFAFPLEDGRFGACRVLLDTTSEQSKKQWGGGSILVACSAHIWNEVPAANDPDLRPILFKTHHSWNFEPELLWLDDQPPADFIPIGRVMPTAEETALARPVFGNWSSLTVQPLTQWRWDNDRESVIAADAEREARDTDRQRESERKRQAYLNDVTLADLRRHRFFAGWTGYPSEDLIEKSRQIMTDTVERLIALGSAASEDARKAVLQECIETFNQLDAESSFIETVEREDICQEFEAVVHACGLGHHTDLADEWREW